MRSLYILLYRVQLTQIKIEALIQRGKSFGIYIYINCKVLCGLYDNSLLLLDSPCHTFPKGFRVGVIGPRDQTHLQFPIRACGVYDSRITNIPLRCQYDTMEGMSFDRSSIS